MYTEGERQVQPCSQDATTKVKTSRDRMDNDATGYLQTRIGHRIP